MLAAMILIIDVKNVGTPGEDLNRPFFYSILGHNTDTILKLAVPFGPIVVLSVK